MKKILFILGLLVSTMNVNAQVIRLVKHEHQADINVYLSNVKYSADVVVYRTKSKYKAQSIPGYWYWDNLGYSGKQSGVVNVFVVKHIHQADFRVYISDKSHEIRLTKEYGTKTSR